VAAAYGIVEAVGIVDVKDRCILRRSIFDLEKDKKKKKKGSHSESKTIIIPSLSFFMSYFDPLPQKY
jgi:hypothetical protein